jgi:hypothetical protein
MGIFKRMIESHARAITKKARYLGGTLWVGYGMKLTVCFRL